MNLKSMKSYIKLFIIIFVAAGAAYCVRPATAASDTGFLPDCDMSSEGSRPCGLNDFLLLGVNLINYMLGISGSLALLFFVWGGFKMLTAGGNSEGVEKGKSAISSAAVGILIVLASWMIVNAVYTTLVEGNSENKQWWTTERSK